MRCEVPVLVGEAMRHAEEMGFDRSCSPEVGQLLQVLAARVRGGTIGEIGSGCGVGAAWIACGLRSDSRFVTVEGDVNRATVARTVLQGYPNVHVLAGDWHEILAHAPFDLLFVDVREAKWDQPETVVRALKPGGTVLLDDLTPQERWPPEWQKQADPVREFWLNHPSLVVTELLVNERSAIILGARLED